MNGSKTPQLEQWSKILNKTTLQTIAEMVQQNLGITMHNFEDFIKNILSHVNLLACLKMNLKWGLNNGKGFGPYSSIIKKTIKSRLPNHN